MFSYIRVFSYKGVSYIVATTVHETRETTRMGGQMDQETPRRADGATLPRLAASWATGLTTTGRRNALSPYRLVVRRALSLRGLEGIQDASSVLRLQHAWSTTTPHATQCPCPSQRTPQMYHHTLPPPPSRTLASSMC